MRKIFIKDIEDCFESDKHLNHEILFDKNKIQNLADCCSKQKIVIQIKLTLLKLLTQKK